MLHGLEFDMEQAVEFAGKWTPRGWLPDGALVRGDQADAAGALASWRGCVLRGIPREGAKGREAAKQPVRPATRPDRARSGHCTPRIRVMARLPHRRPEAPRPVSLAGENP